MMPQDSKTARTRSCLPVILMERFTRRTRLASNLSMANSREHETSLRTLVTLLRSTLRHLEESEGIPPNDPAYLELKSSILRSIAELEIERLGDAHAA
jgi:hypothetical protein